LFTRVVFILFVSLLLFQVDGSIKNITQYFIGKLFMFLVEASATLHSHVTASLIAASKFTNTPTTIAINFLPVTF
jgi:hypothetical protein